MCLNPVRDGHQGVEDVVVERTGAILRFKSHPLVGGFELVTTFEMLKAS